MISIIIRSKNEERWIRECLKRVQAQSVKDVEVVLVDNQSSDRTVERARQIYPDIKVVTISEYKPGAAINAGIRASRGEYIAILSAHCLPVSEMWLESLVADCRENKVAGVYGRQVPTSFSSAQDKRDLLVTFGLDKRVQKKDYFFHNANSLIRKDVWEQYPFDEEVGNIEDRVWAKQVIEAGYTLVYEPEAAVYHYHGIYQNSNETRVEGAVRVMEILERSADQELPIDPKVMEVAAIIPLRSSSAIDSSETLIRKSIEAAKNSEYVSRIIVASDDADLGKRAMAWGAESPFVRPKHLSAPGVRSDEVLQYCLEQLEANSYSPDLIVPLEITHPFRPVGLLDRLIERLVTHGLDTAIAAYSEYRPYWPKDDSGLVLTEEYAHPRTERNPIYVGLLSLGCVTYAEFVRQGSRLGKRVGVYEVDDPFAAIEIRDAKDLALLPVLETAMSEWRTQKATA